ncbi:MAG: FAD-dependent oxidoreductase [Alphaproteobacteria bacterium]
MPQSDNITENTHNNGDAQSRKQSRSQSQSQRQKRAEIAILGAGVMGLSCAVALVERGVKAITIYDPQPLNSAASHQNASTSTNSNTDQTTNASAKAGGMLAPYSEIEHMDMRWVAAGLRGIERWRTLSAYLETGFVQNGSLLIANAPDRHSLERFRHHLPHEKRDYCAPHMIEPMLPEKFKAALYLEEEAHLEPQKTLRALMEYLSDKVSFVQKAIQSPAAMKDIKADHILDCRGMGAAAAQPHLRGVKGETAIVRNPEFSLSRPVRIMHPRYPLYVVPRPAHIFMIGATVIESDEAQSVSLKSSMELMSALYSLHSSFGEAQILEFSAGIRPSYADNLPKIGVSGRIISANGLFRHGYLLAPVMAGAIAEYICDNKKNDDWDLFYDAKSSHQADDQRAA